MREAGASVRHLPCACSLLSQYPGHMLYMGYDGLGATLFLCGGSSDDI